MKERLSFDIFIHPDDPEMLILIPDRELKDNSIYEIKMPDIYSEDGYLLNKHTLKFITSPDPMYVKLEEVLVMAKGLPLEEVDVLFHIREACREANYLVKRAIKKDIAVLDLDKDTIKDE